jgi:NADH dehydrogenase
VVNAVQFPTSPIEVPRKGWTFEEIDYNGTCNQVDAAKVAGVKRFVYMSGVGAAPGAEKHWFRFKWMAEQHLQQSGLEYVIVRPTWVFGPGDKSLNRLIGFSNFLPFVPMFGAGKQDMQPVFIDDVGRVGADAATKPEAANQVFELGGPQVMSMNEVLKTALDVMGRKRFILHQPVFVGKLAGTLAGILPTPPLSADAVDFINEPAVADNVNLARTLHPQLTLFRDGLETYLGR